MSLLQWIVHEFQNFHRGSNRLIECSLLWTKSISQIVRHANQGPEGHLLKDFIFRIISSVSILILGSVVGKINSVDVNPCPSEPCQLKKNTNVTISIDFLPSKYNVHVCAF